MPHSNRILWLDRARGIAILLVVLGHFIQNLSSGIPSLLFFHHFIYSFHMGCFFILSGWLTSSPRTHSKNGSFPYFIKRRILTLLVPYIIFSVLILLAKLIENRFDVHSISLFQRDTLFSTLLMVRESSYFGRFWFFPALFCAEVIFWCVLRIFRHPIAQGFACLTISCSAYCYVQSTLPKLPMNFEVGAVAVTFLWIGFMVRTLPSNFWTHPFYITVSFIALISANIYSFFVAQYEFDSFYIPSFPNPLISVLTTLTGTYLVFAVGHLRIKYLNILGQSSMYIYGLHYLFVGPLSKVVQALNYGRGNAFYFAVCSIMLTGVVVFLCIYIMRFYKKWRK